ncbi:hypothetical protein GW915_01210 [bacterium]|nr:hypothetical protein [bacterium]
MRILALFAICALCSCGGPNKDAIVANTVQTLMANIVESNITILLSDSLSPQDPVPCSGGGTLQVNSPTFGTIDPGTGTATIGGAPVNFNKCIISVCEGHTTTIDGDNLFTINLTASVSLDLDEYSDISLVAYSNGASYSGELSGDLTFSYKLTGELSRTAFGGIFVDDTDPADPLVVEGKSYNAEELSDLAEGC